MKEIKEKYLPIGTVVILKGASKRLMISGFCAIDTTGNKKIWDYSGCMYPEGLLNSNQICLFDHDQIEKIYHIGLSNDDEEKEFKENLKIFMNEFEKGNKELEGKDNIIKEKSKSKKTKTVSKSKTENKATKTKEKNEKDKKTNKKKQTNMK